MNFLKLLIIPLFLVLVYLILLSYPYFFSKINRYDSLGLLSAVEENSVYIPKTIHLLKGEKVSAKVKATENNLGIVLVRFVRFGKVSDKVAFRLKEERKDNWYYEGNNYRAEEFQYNQYFTFGFPPIANSKNKVYVFEIESLAGSYSGIGISPNKPQVALVYKYSRSDLKNYEMLSSFISKKIAYTAGNINLLENWQVTAAFVISSFTALFIKKKKITATKSIGFLLIIKDNPRRALRMIIDGIKSSYLSQEKKIVNFSKKITRLFTLTKFYLLFLNTNTKRRVTIGLLIFLLALTYRFSSTLVNQDKFFYAGLGGQGDYDQFIRVATCALDFCSGILGQNFLIETSILGTFYKIFGFTGALKAYLYFMIILSSFITALPHFLLSRKGWISIGGIIGSVYLATSDFLTHMSLNFPPDNGSLFTFSMFFIVYFLTLQRSNIRWLLLLGLIGAIDALNKALFILNDLVALGLFIPVFFYERVKESTKSIFTKKNIKPLFLSSLPLLIFLTIYIGWEYIVYIKFSAVYFLRGLIESRGVSYVSYTSVNDPSLQGDIVFKLFYLGSSAVVMIKRLIDYIDLRIIFLAPIFLGLFLFSFARRKFPVKKFITGFIFSVFLVATLMLIKNNYYNIHEIFAGEYIVDNWKTNIYIQIFLFSEIIILFILNFNYSVIKLALPIIPYIIMLIILTKNSPFPRLSIHAVAWSVILFAYLINWIMTNISKHSITRINVILFSLPLILFFYIYIFPKTMTMVTQLNSGFATAKDQVDYLKWVDLELPKNAIVLAGGESELVAVAENIKKPIAYNTSWVAAILIRPNEIPGISPTDFSLVTELQNKESFIKNKYFILEDDIYLWRARLTGIGDGVFTGDPKSTSALHASDYSIKVYKYNTMLKKAIYELNLRETVD